MRKMKHIIIHTKHKKLLLPVLNVEVKGILSVVLVMELDVVLVIILKLLMADHIMITAKMVCK